MRKMNNYFKAIAIVTFVLAMASCKKEDPYAAYTPEREAKLVTDWITEMGKKNKDVDTISAGLYQIVEKEGTGEFVKSGDELTVKYTGMFVDGTIFDASAYHNTAGTMTYIHKTDPLISGWEEGIELMKKEGKTVFLISSSKAYGSGGYASIPPNSPLIFVIEVVDIK